MAKRARSQFNARSGELSGLHMTGPKMAFRRSTHPVADDGSSDTAVEMLAKFVGTCSSCHRQFAVGVNIVYNKWSKATYHHPRCPSVSARH